MAEPTPDTTAADTGAERTAAPQPYEADLTAEPAGDPPGAARHETGIEEILDRHLAADAVAERLTRLRSAISARGSWHQEDLDHLVEKLVEYAYQVLRGWVALIVAQYDVTEGWHAGSGLSMIDSDVDRLAEDVVTRAENGFRDELATIRWWLRSDRPDMKTLFLLECALQLPDAYRNWRMGRDRTSWEALEAALAAGAGTDERVGLLQRLYACVSHDRRRAMRVLRDIRYSEAEADEIIGATRKVYELVAAERAGRVEEGQR